MRLHIDTDFAGDPDDACALGMLLGWPDVTITGITTVADPDGRRAGYVTRFLELAGRTGIPVAAGAGYSGTTGRAMGDIPDHDRYWGIPVEPGPVVPAAATALLTASIEQGATVVAIGPYTNLARLARARRGGLAGVPVVAMGGWVSPAGEGFPPWGPEYDWNVQCDTAAAQLLAATADVTLCPLPACMPAHLRRRDLPRLVRSGPLGALLARQAEAYAVDRGRTEVGRAWPALADDLVNFHWDPVTCAVAAGWPGARTEQVPLRPVLDAGVLRFAADPAGRPTRILAGLDGEAFGQAWLVAVEAAQAGSG